MLNSRYIHLHEALGLGPMWLNAQAKILPLSDEDAATPAPAAANAAAVAAVSPANREVAAPFRQPETAAAEVARLAVLKNIGSGGKAVEAQTALAPKTETAPEQDWLSLLEGKVPQADVMALSMCASPADAVAGRLYSGEDGVLLDKMLHAIALDRSRVLLATWLQEEPDFNPSPDAARVAHYAPRVAAQWQLSRARVLLLLGNHFFARADVMEHIGRITEPTRIFRIPHPQQILNDPKLKRGAWETLQRLQQQLSQGGTV